MPKAKALQLLRGFLERAEQLKITSSQDEVYRLWDREATDAVRNLFGDESPQYKGFSQIMFHTVQHAFLGGDHPRVDPREEREQFRRGLQTAKIQLTAMITEVENHWPDDAARPEPRAPLATVLNICDRLPEAVRKLSKRWGKGKRQALTMTDEYDVQYLLGALLAIEFEDVRPEDPGPTHAGASSRRDFVLKTERIAVEAKMTRSGLDDKKLGEELLIDIGRYEAVQDCDTLVCLVYDPDRRLVNPRGLERDLEKTQSRLVVRVRVRP